MKLIMTKAECEEDFLACLHPLPSDRFLCDECREKWVDSNDPHIHHWTGISILAYCSEGCAIAAEAV